MSETDRIEYKQELSKDLKLEREVVAFLNSKEGGVIYIGIDKNGNVVGVQDMDADMLKIKDWLKDNIVPSCLGLFDVKSEKREGKDVIKITIARGSEKPYYLKKYGMSVKGCYYRSGTAADPMPQRMIDNLYARRTRNSIQIIKSRHQDLTFRQLKIFYEESGGIRLNDNFARSLEFLTDEGDYNLVAYLLADNNNNSVKFAKYDGLTKVKLIENEEYGFCSLLKATDSILNRLNVENKTLTRITSKQRLSVRLWDEVALREAVINAFVHNDYSYELCPTFEIFDDRIEITSYGGLSEDVSEEEFFKGVSVPKNKELMRVYKDVDLVEQLGSGIPRILETYDKDCFEFSDNFLRMTFPMNSADILKEPDPVSNVEVSLSKRDVTILQFCAEPKSRAEILNKIGISNTTRNYENNVKHLIDEGFLGRNMESSSAPNQRYFTTKKGNDALGLH